MQHLSWFLKEQQQQQQKEKKKRNPFQTCKVEPPHLQAPEKIAEKQRASIDNSKNLKMGTWDMFQKKWKPKIPRVLVKNETEKGTQVLQMKHGQYWNSIKKKPLWLYLKNEKKKCRKQEVGVGFDEEDV